MDKILQVLQIAMWAGAIFATFYFGWKKKSSQEDTELKEVQKELVNNLKDNSEAWRLKYEKEHDEHVKARDFWHDKAKEDQAILLKANQENQDLKAKTNIVPIMDSLKVVTETMERVSKVMERIEKKLNPITA